MDATTLPRLFAAMLGGLALAVVAQESDAPLQAAAQAAVPPSLQSPMTSPMTSVQSPQQPLLQSRLRVSPLARIAPDGSTARVEQSLWAGRGPVNIGLQWQGPLQPVPSGSVSTSLVPRQAGRHPLYHGNGRAELSMGVAVDLSERARVELTHPLKNQATPVDPLAPPVANDMRLSLELRPNKPLSGLRSGLRVELSRQSTLSVKPRGGGLGISYNSTF